MSSSRNVSLLILLLVLIFAVSLFDAGCSKGPGLFPPTEKRLVTEVYFGNKVIDNYRWLDDLSDPAVRQWNDAQNAATRAFLDRISYREQIYRRVKQIVDADAVRYNGLVFRKKLFALKFQPPKNQPFLVVFESAGETKSERVVLDPNVLNPSGTTAIDWYVPSRDARLVAVSLSENGSEDGSINVFEVETGKKLQDLVPRAQFPTGGGDLEWNRDATGFYYTRYPQGNERPKEEINFFQQIFFHKLGTPSTEDVYVIGKEFPKIAECKIASTEDRNCLLITVANGDGGEFAHYLKDSSDKWVQVTKFSDKAVSAQFGPDGTLYFLSRKDAPAGKILALPPSNRKLEAARTVVSEGDASIADLMPAKSRLYVMDIVGGPSRVRVFDLSGKEQSPIPLKPISAVSAMVRLEGDRILYSLLSYVDPQAWYQYDPATRASAKTPLSSLSSLDFSSIEVSREFAISKDGTKVPLNILMRKGTSMNGQNPTVLYGYGGFGISESPSFDPMLLVWLEQGGVYVLANLRGGGEFGEAWHQAGMLTKKQNVFDDFAACAQYLLDKKFTSPSQLAIEGGSNGGLLMGAALTQHPELFRAVVSHVGIYDMLRFETFPNGVFNVTEYGTIKDPEQFKALYAYSPYHHVEDGKAYPAVMFLTGDHDGRVDPANSRKMTARLQAATSSGLPILLRTNPKAGHGIGMGLSDRIDQETDVYAFLSDQLKLPYKPMVGK